MFCILDIESSGGPFGKEAMIEVALFRFDGEDIVDQLISLVSPHREVQKYVSRMTGITPKMLVRAPRFHELAKRIIQITEGAVLVGHNVDFDYRMLRQEFGRLGYPYERKTLDTITTAEKLIPGLPGYGLDKICAELGIYRSKKHRAEDDARATLELFKILREKDRQKNINILGESVQEQDAIRQKINELLRSIKNNRGLFYLHDHTGKLLYLGASDNINSAVNRIFLTESGKGRELAEKVNSIKVEPAGNWIVARIKKEEELENARPPYNKFRQPVFPYGIYADLRQAKPKLTIAEVNKMGRKKPLVKIANIRTGERALRMYYRLAYFPERAEKIISILRNFPEKAVFVGKGTKPTERCAFIVENHRLLGYRYFSLNDQVSKSSELRKNMAEVSLQEKFTHYLKLGILSGEIQQMDSFPIG